MTLLWLRVQAGHSARQRRIGTALKVLRVAGYGGRSDGLPDTSLSSATAKPGSADLVGPAARAALVLRDNLRNRSSIEKAYLNAIGKARSDILIANAYFLPGGKLRRALVAAARRGVKVTVLLQGRYEYFMQYHASRAVYDSLLRVGIDIHAYSKSFLHAKVAVIDGHWATVGSSNLDPLSLLLAREANVVIEDDAFAGNLRQRLLDAMALQNDQVDLSQHSQRRWVIRFLDWFAYGLMRTLLWVTGKRY